MWPSARECMLTNIEKNITMVEGAYKKLKSYYYYNKNFLIMREKIAQFEANSIQMEETFSKLANWMAQPNSRENKKYFNSIIDGVGFCALPKKFDTEASKKDELVTNRIHKDKNLKTVNFFIDAPIEIYIIDTVWTVLLGKVAFDNQLLTHDIYGNTLANHLLFRDGAYHEEGTINFESNRLFNIYFGKYCEWRNGAFKVIEDNYNKGANTILFSLDLKSYYYNVRFDFDIKGLFGNHQAIEGFETLTNSMKSIYLKYRDIIKCYIKGLPSFKKSESLLPIGLFSSMLLANVYLKDFDRRVRAVGTCCYYGRYVDDLLICFDVNGEVGSSESELIQKFLVETSLFHNDTKALCVNEVLDLCVQKDKIKVLLVSAKESRAIIDLYNENIRITPSQMSVDPGFDLKVADFYGEAYKIENLGSDKKIRNIGSVEVDPFKVSRYFSALSYKHQNIDPFQQENKNEVDQQIRKINEFFDGNTCLEHYGNWQNYMYFLILSRRLSELKGFYVRTKRSIDRLHGNSLHVDQYYKPKTIGKNVRETLLRHLNICMSTAISVDIEIAQGARGKKSRMDKFYSPAKMYMNSNMFNHNLVSVPLANYLEYSNDISYSRIGVEHVSLDVKGFGNFQKVKWTPRFIHFEELLLLAFVSRHNKLETMKMRVFSRSEMIDLYYKINKITNKNAFKIIVEPDRRNEGYVLEKVMMTDEYSNTGNGVLSVGVGNIKLAHETCTNPITDRRKNLTSKNKQMLYGILDEMYKESDGDTKLLVLPELYIPFYWLKEVAAYSKKTQMGIVTGIQYLPDAHGGVKNYIATILPFVSSKMKYKNVLVFIREKNDYSPIEKVELAKLKKRCHDQRIARYQIFEWKNVDIATVVCYEFTDIMARALLKGKCDIIAAPVYNPDTTYFSNIIDSAVRDLHTIIVQSNTSLYGDSRITGPYDRDNKDILKIKGGDNDHVIIGQVKLKEILEYQASYHDNMDRHVEELCRGTESKKKNMKRNKPEIKKLSARYDVARAKRKSKIDR